MLIMSNDLYIGVDLGGTNIQAGVVTSEGNVLATDRTKTKAELGADEVIHRLTKLVHEVCEQADCKPQDTAGLGVGAPGTIDVPRGIVTKAVNLRWDNLPLGQMLQKKIGLRVTVDNDVNVGAWGEFVAGSGRDHSDQLAVFIGTGIGAGLIINNQIYHGSHLTAGEIGHTLSISNGDLGRRSLENLASRTAIVNLLTQLIHANHSSILTELTDGDLTRIRSKVLAQAYSQNDPLTVEVISRAAHHVGVAIANAVTLLSLSCVVVGGGVTEALGDPWVAQIKRAFREYVFPPELQQVPILPSSLEDNAGVVGAGLVAKARFEQG